METEAYVVRNAIIESAEIFHDENASLTIWIKLHYGDNVSQGFGWRNLYQIGKATCLAGHFIWRMMEVAQVREWKHLPGRTVRVKCDHLQVIGVGHIVNEDWFIPKEDFEAMGG